MNAFEAMAKHNCPFIVTSTANLFGGGLRFSYHMHIHKDDLPKIDDVKKESISITEEVIHAGYLKDDQYISRPVKFRVDGNLSFKLSHYKDLLTLDMGSVMISQFRENQHDFVATLKSGSDTVYNYGTANFGSYYQKKKKERMNIELVTLKGEVRKAFFDNTQPSGSTVAAIIEAIDSLISEEVYSKNDIKNALSGVKDLETKLELL